MLADCLVTLGFRGFLPARKAYPQAKAAALRALELDPSHAESRAALGMVLWHLDWDLDGAERELRRAVELGPSNEVARMSLAMFLVLIRNAVEARQAAGRAAPFALAMVSAALGDRDEAFRWLDACLGERDSRLFWLRVRPFFDPLRGDPRFDDCLDRLGGPRVPR